MYHCSVAHLLEAIPRAAPYIVYYNSIPPLCAKLMSIEYIDVADTHEDPVASSVASRAGLYCFCGLTGCLCDACRLRAARATCCRTTRPSTSLNLSSLPQDHPTPRASPSVLLRPPPRVLEVVSKKKAKIKNIDVPNLEPPSILPPGISLGISWPCSAKAVARSATKITR